MTTITTTEAATQAHVTVATIRTWCRNGVVAAAKQAGRWIIDTTSLAHRLTIAAWKRPTRTEATPMIDLTASITVTLPGDSEPRTITPEVKTRTRKDGSTWTTIRRLAPLFADRINAITDEGDRLHALTLLTSSQITITDQVEEGPDEIAGGVAFLDSGRLRVKHHHTAAVPMDAVIDLAKQLRTQLAA